MIWLSWRQFRTQAIVASCVLVAFAIALLVTQALFCSWWISRRRLGMTRYRFTHWRYHQCSG